MAKARERLYEAYPYVTRALQDEEVRENVKSAIAAGREVYDELIGARRPSAVAARVATDSEIQDHLRSAIDDLKKAADRVQGKEEHTARNAILLLTGVILGLLFNPVTGPQTREWLSRKVLGEGVEDIPPAGSGNGGSAPLPG
jgi:hypothetical protein